jgi:hypothetical protein
MYLCLAPLAKSAAFLRFARTPTVAVRRPRLVLPPDGRFYAAIEKTATFGSTTLAKSS